MRPNTRAVVFSWPMLAVVLVTTAAAGLALASGHPWDALGIVVFMALQVVAAFVGCPNQGGST